jgi:hypothetical protein
MEMAECLILGSIRSPADVQFAWHRAKCFQHAEVGGKQSKVFAGNFPK